jgi:choline dehydrogenase-like flavoprotein
MTDPFAPGSVSVLVDPPETIYCDVLIVGSGMGGGTLAYALRNNGARVLVVERGDFLPRELQNWSPGDVHQLKRYANADTLYDSQGDPFQPGTYYYVGGSTKLYGATLPRMREYDFDEIEHPDGLSPAWPVSYADLEPYYAIAENLYFVHGNAKDDPTEPWRSTEFPFPAVPHEPAIARLADALTRQGLRPFHSPQAIDLRPGGRCVRCKTCDSFPCLVDAKGDADVCGIRPALEADNVKLLTNTKVENLQTDPSGHRLSRVIATHKGRRIEILASKFVLAAGALHTAQLLLTSANDAHPDGLANRSGVVGRNYMHHTTSFFMAVDPLHKNDVVYQKTMGINDWYTSGPDNRYPLGNVQGLGKLQGPMVKPARPLVPMPILDGVTGRSWDLFIQTEDVPKPENRVTVDSSGQMTLHWKPTNVSSHQQLIENMKRAVKKAGFPIVLHQALGITGTSHQCGTVKMGNDSAASALDSWGHAHDVENLWVLDTSIFPSSAAVNPALTAAAFVLRTAATGCFND